MSPNMSSARGCVQALMFHHPPFLNLSNCFWNLFIVLGFTTSGGNEPCSLMMRCLGNRLHSQCDLWGFGLSLFKFQMLSVVCYVQLSLDKGSYQELEFPLLGTENQSYGCRLIAEMTLAVRNLGFMIADVTELSYGSTFCCKKVMPLSA